MTEQSEPKTETVVERIAEMPVGAGKTLVIGIETVGRDVHNGAVEGGTAVVDATRIVAGDLAQVGRQLGRDVREAVSRATGSVRPPVADAPSAPPAPSAVVPAPLPATPLAPTSVVSAPAGAEPIPVAVELTPTVVAPEL
jgi:hypothetical protein